MSEAEKYQGYKWITVERVTPVDVNGVPHVPEAHHIKERTFLIEEIRRLAARIDALTSAQSRVRLEDIESMQRLARLQYEEQIDYLPFEDDDRIGDG